MSFVVNKPRRPKLVVLLDDNEVVQCLDCRSTLPAKALLSTSQLDNFRLVLARATRHDVLLIGANPDYFKGGSPFASVFDASLDIGNKKWAFPRDRCARCLGELSAYPDTKIVIVDNSPCRRKGSVAEKKKLLLGLLGMQRMPAENFQFIQYTGSLQKVVAEVVAARGIPAHSAEP